MPQSGRSALKKCFLSAAEEAFHHTNNVDAYFRIPLCYLTPEILAVCEDFWRTTIPCPIRVDSCSFVAKMPSLLLAASSRCELNAAKRRKRPNKCDLTRCSRIERYCSAKPWNAAIVACKVRNFQTIQFLEGITEWPSKSSQSMFLTTSLRI